MMRPIVGPANPLGIEKPAEMQNLSFYPNPVTDGNLYIQVPETWGIKSRNTLNLSIISATGSCVLSEKLTEQVDVRSLAPGLYMLLLTDNAGGKKASGKLIIR